MNIRNRKGTFRVSAGLIDTNPEIIMMVLARCLVVRAEILIMYDCVEYCAYSPEFDIVPEGVVAPEYRVEITEDDARSKSIMFVRAV